MPLTDFRMVNESNLVAKRAAVPMFVNKGNSLATKNGLRYENRVWKQLKYHVELKHVSKVEHNPWFIFSDVYGSSSCCPDFLIWLGDHVIITEVKLTWVETAAPKLTELYRPVIKEALQVDVSPLIIVKNLTPFSPPASMSLREALRSPYKLLHYFDTGRMLW
jgi:hypothetical protein